MVNIDFAEVYRESREVKPVLDEHDFVKDGVVAWFSLPTDNYDYVHPVTHEEVDYDGASIRMYAQHDYGDEYEIHEAFFWYDNKEDDNVEITREQFRENYKITEEELEDFELSCRCRMEELYKEYLVRNSY